MADTLRQSAFAEGERANPSVDRIPAWEERTASSQRLRRPFALGASQSGAVDQTGERDSALEAQKGPPCKYPIRPECEGPTQRATCWLSFQGRSYPIRARCVPNRNHRFLRGEVVDSVEVLDAAPPSHRN
jgi:hypothetical protein